MGGWMDVWMDDTLKASPTWTFLSFLQEQFSFITIKRNSRCKMDDKFDGIVYFLVGQAPICNGFVMFP
jgi:hypothetical protein